VPQKRDKISLKKEHSVGFSIVPNHAWSRATGESYPDLCDVKGVSDNPVIRSESLLLDKVFSSPSACLVDYQFCPCYRAACCATDIFPLQRDTVIRGALILESAYHILQYEGGCPPLHLLTFGTVNVWHGANHTYQQHYICPLWKGANLL
jgi:hypothetical protein